MKKIPNEIKEEIKKEELFEKNFKKKKHWISFKNFLNDFGLYTFTIFGVLLSKYIPDFKTGNDIILKAPQIGNLIISVAVALIVSVTAETGGDKAGKRKNWIRRATFHLANGMMWNTFING